MRRAPASGRPSAQLTPTQYARHRGVSKQAVAKAIRDGRIPTTGPRGRQRIDPAIADAAWDVNTDPSKPKGPRSKANGSAPAPGTQAAESARLTRVRARKIERELEQMERSLVDARAAEAHFQKLTRETRDKFLALADRLGPEFSPGGDPRQMTLRMRQEFSRFLAEMAGDEAEPEDQRARASG